ncbi:hypothetical protein ABIE09_004832 [Lysobacter enzymogenes]|uniref:hypothetical protein n=1 Tax=Lysobacter enzymogenes TaxID=69 RepID=UPI0033994E71
MSDEVPNLLSVLLDSSEGGMKWAVSFAGLLWLASRLYNSRDVRTMIGDIIAAARTVGRAFAAALRIPGEKSGGRIVAIVNAAVFCMFCGYLIVLALTYAATMLARGGALSFAQFAIGAAVMIALTVAARLCRAEAYRALAKR